MSNRKSKLSVKFPKGKWNSDKSRCFLDEYLASRYVGPLPSSVIELITRAIFEGKTTYKELDSDEKLSNFIYQVLKNKEYQDKFLFNSDILDELRSIWNRLTNGQRGLVVKNIIFKLK
jgi:hypothetical protein